MIDRGRDEYGQFVSYLPRYYDHHKSYLELHDNHTIWDLENENKTDEEYLVLVEEAVQFFELRTETPLFLLGRSGRHVCVEDNYKNSKRYQWLKRVALELEQNMIDTFNTK